jgi:hypothetical protein
MKLSSSRATHLDERRRASCVCWPGPFPGQRPRVLGGDDKFRRERNLFGCASAFEYMELHTRRWSRSVYLAMAAVGGIATVIGGLSTLRVLNLISLQQQGKCDFVPCADAGTYRLALALALIGVTGIVLLATAFIHWFAHRP